MPDSKNEIILSWVFITNDNNNIGNKLDTSQDTDPYNIQHNIADNWCGQLI